LQTWDRIYISTVFTFHWKYVINTISFYLNSVKDTKNIIVGGSMATIMSEEIINCEGFEKITIIHGLLDEPNQFGDGNDIIIDELIPDYDIIDIKKNEYLQYEYKITDAYFVHATRGCIRSCGFCAVPEIEPCFKEYFDIKDKINEINKKYGEKRDLMMMDNNILASPHFETIVEDIIACGFGIDSNTIKYTKKGRTVSKRRYVDFNQGVDARIIRANPKVMELISRIAIRPLRIAFDHSNDEFIEIYRYCVELAAEHGIKQLSNYIFFNYEDTPNELYKRLKINTELNARFECEGKATRIWSFPMKYTPLRGEHSKDRRYVGHHWTRKQLRGLQCILNATHGVVGYKSGYFYRAYGKDLDEFNRILLMPERMIFNRNECEDTGETGKWLSMYQSLNEEDRNEFFNIVSRNYFKEAFSTSKSVEELLRFYH
jgi:hypothetical protein